MTARTIRDQRELQAWFTFLQSRAFPMTVSYAKGAKRSLPQNATFHAWVGQIAQATHDSQEAIKGECKLRFGLPIMERDNVAWVAKWEPLYGPLPYAMRLRLFEALPVTSKFTTRQMAEFMDAVQREYSQQGIYLIDPDAQRYEGIR